MGIQGVSCLCSPTKVSINVLTYTLSQSLANSLVQQSYAALLGKPCQHDDEVRVVMYYTQHNSNTITAVLSSFFCNCTAYITCMGLLLCGLESTPGKC